MLRSLRPLLVLLLLFLSAAAYGATPAEDAAGYCRYAEEVARSESALLLSPQLYLNLGLVQGYDPLFDPTIGGPTGLRLMAGLSYSVRGMYQGLLGRLRAQADCQRYRVAAEMHGLLQSSQELTTKPALQARLDVLEAAMPRAQEVLDALAERLRRSAATLDEMQSTRTRVEALRSQLNDTRAAMLSAPESLGPAGAGGKADERLLRREEAEARVANLDARLRRSQAWDLSLRGGFDKTYGLPDRLPFSGMASLTLNPGWLLQLGAETRAQAARRQWIHNQQEGLGERYAHMLRKLRAARAAESARLWDLDATVRDLEDRVRSLSALQGERIQRYRDYFWLDLIKAQAEQAYLRAHVQELARVLGEERAE